MPWGIVSVLKFGSRVTASVVAACAMHHEAECDDGDGSDLADLPRTSEDEWLMWIEGRSGKPSEEPAEESPSKGDLDKSTTSDHPENENETQPMVDHPQCVVAPSRRSPRRPVRASRMSLQRRRRTASGSSAQGGEDDGEDGQDEGEADDDELLVWMRRGPAAGRDDRVRSGFASWEARDHECDSAMEEEGEGEEGAEEEELAGDQPLDDPDTGPKAAGAGAVTEQPPPAKKARGSPSPSPLSTPAAAPTACAQTEDARKALRRMKKECECCLTTACAQNEDAFWPPGWNLEMLDACEASDLRSIEASVTGLEASDSSGVRAPPPSPASCTPTKPDRDFDPLTPTGVPRHRLSPMTAQTPELVSFPKEELP